MHIGGLVQNLIQIQTLAFWWCHKLNVVIFEILSLRSFTKCIFYESHCLDTQNWTRPNSLSLLVLLIFEHLLDFTYDLIEFLLVLLFFHFFIGYWISWITLNYNINKPLCDSWECWIRKIVNSLEHVLLIRELHKIMELLVIAFSCFI